MIGNGDYISRESANEACREAVRRYPNSFYNGIEAARDAIRKLPAADVREVVMCKDCRYAYDSVGGWCCSHGVCVDCIVREDFFCADSEKKEG